MKKASLFFLFFSFVIFTNSAKAQEVTCQLTGKVVGFESKHVYIRKYTSSMQSAIAIPVINGSFEYTFTINPAEVYKIHPEGSNGYMSGIHTNFIPIDGVVEITIHSENEWHKNSISGGQSNLEVQNFYNKYWENYGIEINQLNASSEIGLSGEKRKEQLYYEFLTFKKNYVDSNSSMLSYCFLLSYLRNIERNEVGIDYIYKNYERLSAKYPKHIYTQSMTNMFEAVDNIKIGQSYTDFQAPSLEGQNFRLSNLIKGKVAVIDLWASWCGPCIKKSRKIVPLYEDYKDKGFTVIGVAREFHNTKQLESRLVKEKFPWINLVDLDDQFGIWEKYGVPNGGGAVFLIDAAGKILAINPTVEDIKNSLAATLD